MNEFHGDLNGTGKRFAIVVTRFNSLITEQLVTGATDCLLRHGVGDGDIDLYQGPWCMGIAIGGFPGGRD